MNWLRFGSRASALVVAAVAGYSSWRHIVEVASRAGEDATVAAVLPLSVDGLVVVASLAMLEDKRALLEPRLSARVGLGFGILATLAFNLASADRTGTAMAVAAVPAVAFLLSVEVLSRSGKRKGAHLVSTPALPVSTVPGPAPVAAVTVTAPVPQADPGASESGHPEPVKVKPARKPRADKTADRVRKAAAEMPSDTSLAKIAAKAGVSETTARRHLTDHQPQALLLVATPAVPDAEMAAATGSNGSKAST